MTTQVQIQTMSTMLWDNVPFARMPPTDPNRVLGMYNDQPPREYTIKEVRSHLCLAPWVWNPIKSRYQLELNASILGPSFDPSRVLVYRAIVKCVEDTETPREFPQIGPQDRAAIELVLNDQSWISPIPVDVVPSLREMSCTKDDDTLILFAKRVDASHENEPEAYSLELTYETEGTVPDKFMGNPPRFGDMVQSLPIGADPTLFPFHPPSSPKSAKDEKETSKIDSISGIFGHLRQTHGDQLAREDLLTCTSIVARACAENDLYASPSELRHLVRLLCATSAEHADALARDIWTA